VSIRSMPLIRARERNNILSVAAKESTLQSLTHARNNFLPLIRVWGWMGGGVLGVA
jgi:hypothetical protein